MKALMIFWIAVAMLTACGETAGDGDYESSPPARLVAQQDARYASPDDFGLDSGLSHDPVHELPGYGNWYCPASLVTRAQMATYLARVSWGVDFEHPTYDGRFTDVSQNMIHSRTIGRVVDAGLMKPCGDAAFCPDHVVTRAQAAVYVASIVHGDAPVPMTDTPFGDLGPADPKAEIAWVASKGVTGCAEGTFCPDEPITRDQMASFLAAAMPDAPPGALDFEDVAETNPNAAAIAKIARAGVTKGCEAPVLGYRLEGYPLTERQRDWLLYFASRWLPRLEDAYGDVARARQVAANAIWWGLKQGVFGRFEDPFGHSVCHMSSDTRQLEPFDACPEGNIWQVGLNAVQMPRASTSEVNAAVAALYPGETPEEVAASVIGVGRRASRIGGNWEYPDWAEDRVLNDGYLMRSWLVRDPAIAAWVLADDIESECVRSWSNICQAQGRSESLNYAESPEVAREVRADLERLLLGLRPR